jgi:hypothetical protein
LLSQYNYCWVSVIIAKIHYCSFNYKSNYSSSSLKRDKELYSILQTKMTIRSHFICLHYIFLQLLSPAVFIFFTSLIILTLLFFMSSIANSLDHKDHHQSDSNRSNLKIIRYTNSDSSIVVKEDDINTASAYSFTIIFGIFSFNNFYSYKIST